jgi:protein-S-isoprenylcysteine O-methyltransferase Ste14
MALEWHVTTKREDHVANPIRLLLHVPVPWVFVLTYLFGVGLESLYRRNIRPSPALFVSSVVGSVLLATGAAIAAWSLLIFHKAHTTTVPGSASTKLVTSGPYRISRNPMYVGLIVAYLGEAGLLKQVWPLLVLPLTVAYLHWIVIPVEEERLNEVFGRAYQEYCARVRRWI